VYRTALGKPALYVEDANIVAIASDAAALDGLQPGQQLLDLNQPQQILEWLLQRVK
jgi:molybdopterin-guanine dinucleotide biosynthesis protein B